jgi:hypothetical protein
VGSEKSCKDLIVVLSSQLNKEFQTLRFPDPGKSSLVTASYIDMGKYLTVQSSEERLRVCGQIAEFLLRFVTLVAAMTASISISEAIPELTENVFIPVLQKPIRFRQVDERVLGDLSPIFVKYVNANNRILADKYYLNTAGYIYKIEDGRARVLGVEVLYAGESEQFKRIQSLARTPLGSVGSPRQNASRNQFRLGVSGQSQRQSVEDLLKAQEFKRREREIEERERESRRMGYPYAAAAPFPAYQPSYYGQPPKRVGFSVAPTVPAAAQALTQAPAPAPQQQQPQSIIPPSTVAGPASVATVPVTLPQAAQGSVASTVRVQPQTGGQNNFTYNVDENMYAAPRQNFRSSINITQKTPVRNTRRNNRSNTEVIPTKLNEFYTVRLYDIKDLTTATALSNVRDAKRVGEFRIDAEGHAWSSAFIQQMQERDQVPQVANSVPFSEIMDVAFEKGGTDMDIRQETVQTTNSLNIKESATNITRSNISSEEVVKQLRVFGVSMINPKVIQSPAAYRAYLLATEVPTQPAKSIRTSFCKSDEWRTKKSLRDVAAYALLEALFKDSPNDSTSSAADKSKFITQMLNEGLLESAETTSANGGAQTFRNYIFSQTIFNDASLKGVCESGGVFTSPEYIKVLTGAYTQLRALYTQHLKAVIEFINTLFVVDTTLVQTLDLSDRRLLDTVDVTRPLLRLHPAFTTNVGGSMAALNERVRAGRALLVAHYMKVEKVYQQALQSITETAKGQTLTVTAVKERRKTRRNRRW